MCVFRITAPDIPVFTLHPPSLTVSLAVIDDGSGGGGGSRSVGWGVWEPRKATWPQHNQVAGAPDKTPI